MKTLIDQLLDGETTVTEAVKTTVGYKIFHVRRDGTIGPLFINRRQVVPTGEWIPAEDPGPQRGYQHRPGWHAAPAPEAPHLMTKSGKLASDRKWYKVHLRDAEKIKRPKAQGGHWYLAKHMKVIGPVEEAKRHPVRQRRGPSGGITPAALWRTCPACKDQYPTDGEKMSTHWPSLLARTRDKTLQNGRGLLCPGSGSPIDLERVGDQSKRGVDEMQLGHAQADTCPFCKSGKTSVQTWSDTGESHERSVHGCENCNKLYTVHWIDGYPHHIHPGQEYVAGGTLPGTMQEAAGDDRHTATPLGPPGKSWMWRCDCKREECSHSTNHCTQPAKWRVQISGHKYNACDHCLPEP